MKGIMFFMLSVVLLFSVHALSVSDYPEVFFHNGDMYVTIVVGDNDAAHAVLAQSAIAQDLAEKSGAHEGILAKLASEVDDLDHDLIVIGNPCKNAVMEQIIAPTPCDTFALGSDGVIEIRERGSYTYVIVAGTSPNAIRASAQVLIDQSTYNFQEERVDFVITNNNNPEQPVIEEIDTQKLRDDLLAQLLAMQKAKQNSSAKNASIPVISPVCNGCMLLGVCYEQFTVQDAQYCDGGWKARKSVDVSCVNDLECLSEVCEGTCKLEVVPKPLNFWSRVTLWFSNTFSRLF